MRKIATNCIIRKIKPSEYKLLNDFLYEAIFIPEGVEPPPRDIIYQPELFIYVSDFGKSDDCCLLAEIRGEVIGAVWCRHIKDYGYVNTKTPSLAISVLKEYRGKGIGTQLINNMLLELSKRGYKQVSLSVQKENYALKMYLKAGFEVLEEKEGEYIMVKVIK